ncbi:MAG: T9SS type A sorting domain-containing protein, partial [Chlamydiia bacterium]|nr:T9SS type A sorting domain-containing protein [Chlamydiia bacterium]
WDEVEVMLADNEVISEYLFGTQQGTEAVWPLCSEVAGSVDMNGNLQMFILATSTYSMHPDSIGYSYVNDLDYIFNLELNADGVQTVMFVDSVMAGSVADDSEFAYGGTTGWGNRLSSSKTDNENAVFVVWTDTPNAVDYNNENAKPDIKAAGKFVGGDFNDFPLTNFTADDLYTGYYFFIYVSQHAIVNGNYFEIPVTTTVTPTEYGANGELDAVTHTYLSGIGYLVSGINENISAANTIKVSQNTPNPFNGSTRITVTTETTANVMIEISNIMGQTIYTSREGRIRGSKEIILNANNIDAGVYFYTVTVGHQRITKKMIVK